VQYAKKNSKQQMNFSLFAVTNVNKKHYQDSIEELMNAYHANKGGHMAKSIQQMVEEAIQNMIADGKIIINESDSGDQIEDLEVAIASTEDDDYDSDDESSEDEDEDEDDDK
jgi:Ran GTPase-activating protein (RanGAP) involved in mRNA processing and transport